MKELEIKTVKEILDNKEIAKEAKVIHKILSREQCRNHIIPSDDIRKFGIEMGGLMCSVLESYYQYRLNKNIDYEKIR